MKESPLMIKSKRFAVNIVRICNTLKKNKAESVLVNQLLRSGTSIGANIREAFYGYSKADFISKLHIALKECSESEYWIELLFECGYFEDKSLVEQCGEIKKMLISAINTAKNNQ